MRSFIVTLAADGTSDRCLLHPIRWVATQALTLGQTPAEGLRVQFAQVPPIPLDARIRSALQHYPCDVLLVHRDSEKENPERRLREINEATASLQDGGPIVPVIPIRMSEAWLLISEQAIREAAGNPTGREPLSLPRHSDLEALHDPKDTLRKAILAASSASGRRREQLKRDLPKRIHRVAELIEDFSPLKALSAFRQFESAFTQVIAHTSAPSP
jgi:hypothetical protein